jgi:hypothetical protein
MGDTTLLQRIQNWEEFAGSDRFVIDVMEPFVGRVDDLVTAKDLQ